MAAKAPIRPTFPSWLTPSSAVLILANLVPLGGVLFFGWKVFPILLLFWIENLIIGVLNVVKILLASPGNRAFWGVKVFLVPFFCVHYGIFCFVHGAFVIAFFGGQFEGRELFPSLGQIGGIVAELGLGWAVASLFISQAFSLVVNYLRAGRFRRANPGDLMLAPYGRIIVLHVAIILGGFLLMALNSPMLGLLLLIAGKVALDLKAHLREHRQSGAPLGQL